MINNIDSVQKDLDIHMKKCINNFIININKVYIGRVSAHMLDSIMVKYYGNMTSVSQLTSTIVKDSRTLSITVFDPNMIKIIEKAILASNLSIIPVSNQNIIHVTLPVLTEERRFTLIKVVRSESEKSKISIRNIRRIFNDKCKALLKKKEISEDEERCFQDNIQSATNIWIKKIDSILKEKELELIRF